MVLSDITFTHSLISLGGIFLLACCSPGPVFLLIASTSARFGRGAGLRVGLGVAGATFVWSSITVLGLGVLLATVVWAQMAIRVFAGAYLIWLGLGLLRSSLRRTGSPRDAQSVLSHTRKGVVQGFVASITNPKALAFFGSAFALTAPPQPTALWSLAAVLVLTGLSALWHCGLAFFFAAPRIQQGYSALRRQIDFAVGMLLATLGAGLLSSPLRRGG